MKKIVITSILLLFSLQVITAQKLNEPKHLGTWIAGEDPSEFLLHRVLEPTEKLLKENPNGKLIATVCGGHEFYGSFVSTTMNPLAVSRYNEYKLLIPKEKIFVALSSNCKSVFSGDIARPIYVYTQFWFVTDKAKFNYKEIYSVKNIEYKTFEDKRSFVTYLKNNKKAIGLIVFTSNDKNLRNKVSEVESLITKNRIYDRFKSIQKVIYTFDIEGKLVQSELHKQEEPDLIAITIKKKKL